MNEQKLFGKMSKEKYHSYRGKIGKLADNIINRDFKADKHLQKWTTDMLAKAFNKFPKPNNLILHSD